VRKTMSTRGSVKVNTASRKASGDRTTDRQGPLDDYVNDMIISRDDLRSVASKPAIAHISFAAIHYGH
jgi:hypothetical protein